LFFQPKQSSAPRLLPSARLPPNLTALTNVSLTWTSTNVLLADALADAGSSEQTAWINLVTPAARQLKVKADNPPSQSSARRQ
jgi:hypothetical protein